MAEIKPFGDYVLVEAILEETQTASGIVLPDSGKEKPGSGRVLAIGSGKVNEHGVLVETKDLNIGDVVFFKKYAPEEIEDGENKYMLIQYGNIIAKKS